MKKKYLRGSRQWASGSANFLLGCRHNCQYCYGKALAIDRGIDRGGSTVEGWYKPRLNKRKFKAEFERKKDRVMFPSSHDILPEFIDESLDFLGRLVNAYDEVLVTSKPHIECIEKICDRFTNRKEKILFRFTIGSSDSEVLRFWEPEAPAFAERLECLKITHEKGYRTSVSCEPMLDNNIGSVIDEVEKYVNDTIWLGKMNYPLKRLQTNGVNDFESIRRAKELMMWQEDLHIKELYRRFKDNPKIRFKDSIAKVARIKTEKEW